MFYKALSKQKINKYSFLKINFKNAFLTPDSPWTANSNVNDLPTKGVEIDRIAESTKTYTKWFNPHTFDPRTPDYFETVRSEWQEDVTREHIGECKIILFLIT
jgi:hypothetical protein